MAGHVQGLAARHRLLHQTFKQSLAPITRCFQLSLEPQAYGAFDAHGAELGLRPSAGGHGCMKVAGRQGHRAQPVATAQHDRRHGHAQGGSVDKEARGVAHHRRLLGGGPDHEAGCVDEGHERHTTRVGQLHEARELVAGRCVERAAQVARLARGDGHRAAT